jgi:hypothetical protein
MPADGHSAPRKPETVRLGQAGLHTAPATAVPTLCFHSAGRFHTPGFWARSLAVATAPGLVVDAITGWMKSRRFELPAPQNVAATPNGQVRGGHAIYKIKKLDRQVGR